MPDTIAENRNTTGMSGVDHHGFALMDPKMNPTYPCNRNADGMPMTVMMRPILSSRRSASGLMSSLQSDSAPYSRFFQPVDARQVSTSSLRKSNQISSTSTAIKYQRYTNPNIAIADSPCGVKYISYDRSGCPRCICNGSGATMRNASAVRSASRYVGRTAATLNTRSRDA